LLFLFRISALIIHHLSLLCAKDLSVTTKSTLIHFTTQIYLLKVNFFKSALVVVKDLCSLEFYAGM